MTQSTRAVYRLVYPLAERPTLQVGRHSYEVVDISEKGVAYDVKDRPPPAIGTPVSAALQFRRGDEFPVTGEVLRCRDSLVVLALDPALPFAEIMAEQRYLRLKGYFLKA